jgi:hypothetical protein
MSDTYQGPAVVVTERSEIAVSADLSVEFDLVEQVTSEGFVVREPGLRFWGGVISTNSAADIWAMGNLKLRLPDERVGSIVVVSTGSGAGEFRIAGSGPAPFGSDDVEQS